MDQNELRKMLKDLLNVESGLSDWEVNFIDSLSKRAVYLNFSPKESAIIERLWGSKC